MRIETVSRELYTFEELSEAAKENARDWYREGLYMDNFEFECVTDDAKEIAALMGIDIDNIYWSGFASQGDGACFEGTYAYKKGSVKAVKEYAPLDEELHRIVKALAAVQKKSFYKLEATVKQSGRYYHAYSTDVEVYHNEDRYHRDIGEAEDEIKEALRDFMDWIYKQLDSQNDYINSNEYIDENIIANEYEFTQDGRRA